MDPAPANSETLSLTQTVRGACPHDCPDTCALLTTVKDGVAVKLQGNPEHPHTAGVLCTKVSRYIERNDHAGRLVQPMRRSGPKGSGRFEPVSWDEALDDIAARLTTLKGIDPETIVPYSYAGTMGLVQGESMDRRFFHKLGASLLDRTICSTAGGEAFGFTLGGKVGMRVEFFAEAKLILIWGSNSIASNLHFWRHAQAAKRAGARLVCIDPRKTETADKCDEHIAILPGTDAALALALMHELIVHDWLDHDYLANYTLGWEQLRERALQWPPARAAQVCGVPQAQIVELARAYGTTKPAAIRLNYGMQRVRGGGNAARAVACLPALTGAWRHRAGGVLLSSSGQFPIDRAALQRPDLLAGRSPRTINMATIGDALLDTAHPDQGARRLQQQPGGDRAGLGQGGAGLRARGPLHRGDGAVSDRHRRLRRLPAAGHHPAGALGHPLQLRPHRCAAQHAGHRAARPGAQQHLGVSRTGAAHGFHRPLLFG